MEDSATNVSVQQLVEAGAHFGHQKRRWNPKMKRFIFEARHGLYIIDLAKTLQQLRNAIGVVKHVIESGRSILFVGTKKQAKGVIKEAAEACGEFYVCERWLGGMLTNMSTIRQSIKTLEKIEKKMDLDNLDLTKKELLLLGKRQAKLNKNLSGIRSMRSLPGLLIVVDPGYENIAIAEASKLGIPVMALVDTNCDPDPIDYVIPCNDDSLKSIKIIIQALAQTVVNTKRSIGLDIVPQGTLQSHGGPSGKKSKPLGQEELLNMKYSSGDEKEPS